MKPRVHVAVGVIFNRNRDSVLIARRLPHQHLAGLWEFPGGKLHDGEDVEQAMRRELAEELGIDIAKSMPLMQIRYDYPDKKVLLDVHAIEEWQGEPAGLENQEIRWVSLTELNHYAFPPANRNIVMQLVLPSAYLISRAGYQSLQHLTGVLKACMYRGLQLFQLRVPGYDDRQIQEVIRIINELRTGSQLQLILNAGAEAINHYALDGIHLTSRRLFEYQSRPVSTDYLLGASCHNRQELEQADRLDVDYVFLSPVQQTASHPKAEVLGWEGFEALCKYANRPVYALGGMTPGDLEMAIEQGAQGIAMIEAVWGADAPGEVIGSMLGR